MEDIYERKTKLFPFSLASLLSLGAGQPQAAESQTTGPVANKLVIHADRGKETINRNIYGHFSEHLGRCIYEGIWVGAGVRSPIPAAFATMSSRP